LQQLVIVRVAAKQTQITMNIGREGLINMAEEIGAHAKRYAKSRRAKLAIWKKMVC
jgi:hypothetical protein